MIYVTGDTHGDIERFKAPEFKKIHRGDTLIICGDFGFLWDNSKQEAAALKKLMSKYYTIAFIDGCHENFDLLEAYPEIKWKGGKARYIGGNIYDFRRDSINWWEREQPTHDEITTALKNLSDNNNKVDYIITHEPPASLKDCLGVDIFERLEVHAFFEEIIRTCQYEKWFFGKCHIDKHIPIKFYAVFNDIIQL